MTTADPTTTVANIVRVKCSKTHFFEALIADQMHDFLLHTGVDERASAMASVVGLLDKLHRPQTDVEHLVWLWQTTLDPTRTSRFKRVVSLCSNQFRRPPSASQHSAELVVTSSPQDATAQAYEHGTRIADFVPLSKLVDRPDAPVPTDACAMFDAPLFTYVRPLTANEFDCFISRLRDYNIRTHNGIDPHITIVVDATKNRDITLMSNLSMRLQRRPDAKDKWEAQAIFQTILPNMFDQAGADSHTTEQRDMNFFGIHRPESSCEFEIVADPLREPPASDKRTHRLNQPLSGHRIMTFQLRRLPNVFEAMYYYSVDRDASQPLSQPLSERYHGLVGTLDRKMHDAAFPGPALPAARASWLTLHHAFFRGTQGGRARKTDYVLFQRFGHCVRDEGYDLYEALSPVIKVQRLVKILASIYDEIQRRWVETCHLSQKFPTIVDYMLAWFRAVRAKCAFHQAFIAEFAPSYASIQTPQPPPVPAEGPVRSDVKMPTIQADFMYAVCKGSTPTETFRWTFQALLIKWSVLIDFLQPSTGPLDMRSFGYVYALLHPHEQAICTELTLFGDRDSPNTFKPTLEVLNGYFMRDGRGPSVSHLGDVLLEIYASTRHSKCDARLTGTDEPMSIATTAQMVEVVWNGRDPVRLSHAEFARLFATGYVTYRPSTDTATQQFDKSDFYRTVLCAMLLKTLCDLSMTTWCAYRNQHPRSHDKHMLLTFDRLSASISTLFVDMEHYILFQSVEAHKKTICVHPSNGAFAAESTLDCFKDASKILTGHQLTFGQDSIEWQTMRNLLDLVPFRRPQLPPPVDDVSDDVSDDVVDDVVDRSQYVISDLDYADLRAIDTLYQLRKDAPEPTESPPLQGGKHRAFRRYPQRAVRTSCGILQSGVVDDEGRRPERVLRGGVRVVDAPPGDDDALDDAERRAVEVLHRMRDDVLDDAERRAVDVLHRMRRADDDGLDDAERRAVEVLHRMRRGDDEERAVRALQRMRDDVVDDERRVVRAPHRIRGLQGGSTHAATTRGRPDGTRRSPPHRPVGSRRRTSPVRASPVRASPVHTKCLLGR